MNQLESTNGPQMVDKITRTVDFSVFQGLDNNSITPGLKIVGIKTFSDLDLAIVKLSDAYRQSHGISNTETGKYPILGGRCRTLNNKFYTDLQTLSGIRAVALRNFTITTLEPDKSRPRRSSSLIEAEISLNEKNLGVFKEKMSLYSNKGSPIVTMTSCICFNDEEKSSLQKVIRDVLERSDTHTSIAISHNLQNPISGGLPSLGKK